MCDEADKPLWIDECDLDAALDNAGEDVGELRSIIENLAEDVRCMKDRLGEGGRYAT